MEAAAVKEVGQAGSHMRVVECRNQLGRGLAEDRMRLVEPGASVLRG